MKKLLILSFCSLLFINANAADSTFVQQKEVRNVWLGVSAGINNPSAMLGLSMDVAFNKNVALFIGAGVGSWGTKFSFGAKYYKEFPFSGSFNLSYSTVSGGELKDYNFENKNYNITLDHINTLNVSYQPHFRLGSRAIFALEVGYSFAFKDPKKSFTSNIAMPENLSNAFKLMSPGGLILGVGFTFGL